MELQVRPARGAEGRLCRMLLGHEGSTDPHYHLFLAVDASDRPLGAGSVRSGAEAAGEFWGVHFDTLPAFRGSGVDEQLLAYAWSFVVRQGAHHLQTLRWFEPESEGVSYWKNLGFTVQQGRYAHEIDVERGYSRLAPLLEQVRDHGWIPEDARTIALAEADLRQVCDLHLQHLGGSIRHLLPMLDGTAPHPYDRQASVVLLWGDRPVGFTLGWFPEPTVCEVGANVLQPSVRLGWADVLLKHDAIERVRARHATKFRFFTAEHHTDTRRTLKWVGGGTTRCEVRLQCRGQPAADAGV